MMWVDEQNPYDTHTNLEVSDMKKTVKKTLPEMLTPLNLSPLERKSFELWVLEMLVNNTTTGRKHLREIQQIPARKTVELVKEHYTLMHSEN
jgi:hypothetical protein